MEPYFHSFVFLQTRGSYGAPGNDSQLCAGLFSECLYIDGSSTPFHFVQGKLGTAKARRHSDIPLRLRVFSALSARKETWM
jgi:hypothetical protein